MASDTTPQSGQPPPRKTLEEIRAELAAEFDPQSTAGAETGAEIGRRATTPTRRESAPAGRLVDRPEPGGRLIDRLEPAGRLVDRLEPRYRLVEDDDEPEPDDELEVQHLLSEDQPRRRGYVVAGLIGCIVGQLLLLAFLLASRYPLAWRGADVGAPPPAVSHATVAPPTTPPAPAPPATEPTVPESGERATPPETAGASEGAETTATVPPPAVADTSPTPPRAVAETPPTPPRAVAETSPPPRAVTEPSPAPPPRGVPDTSPTTPPAAAPVELPRRGSSSPSPAPPSDVPRRGPAPPSPAPPADIPRRIVDQPPSISPADPPVRRRAGRFNDWAESQAQVRAALTDWLARSGRRDDVIASDIVVILGADGRTAKTHVPTRWGSSVVIREQRWAREAHGWSLVDDREAWPAR